MKKILITGISTILACIILLVVTSLIPARMIQKNISKSADYLMERELFDRVDNHSFLSRQDNYADAILTNIIYCMDSDDLITSLTSCGYYNPDGEVVNQSLMAVVSMDGQPKEDIVDYSRYWHGSMVILRPLFTIFSIKNIRLLLGLIYMCMMACLLVYLWRDGYRHVAVSLLIGMAVTSQWMLGFCLEYVMSFLVMGAVLLWFYIRYRRLGDDSSREMLLYQVLCVSGIVTAFVDFLTTETVTFLMPVMLYLILCWNGKNEADKVFGRRMLTVVRGGIIWGVFYAGMFLLKWLIAMMILGKDAFMDAVNQAALRMGGEATYGNVAGAANVPAWERITGALWRNIGCLFPFKEKMVPNTVIICALCGGFILFAIWYLFHKKVSDRDREYIVLLLLAGLIPYVRFLVLNNHSYIHFFFTFRAQFATILGIMYICIRDIDLIDKKGKKV